MTTVLLNLRLEEKLKQHLQAELCDEKLQINFK